MGKEGFGPVRINPLSVQLGFLTTANYLFHPMLMNTLARVLLYVFNIIYLLKFQTEMNINKYIKNIRAVVENIIYMDGWLIT